MPAAALLSNADRTRQLAARARSRGHASGPMPAYQPPDRIEAGYAAALRSMVSRAAERAYAPLIAALPGLVAQARAERGDAADWRIDASHSGRSASAAVRAAKASMAGEVSTPAVAAVAKSAGQDVDAHSRGQVGKQVRQVLGIDLAGAANADQRALVAGFVHENVRLITGITPTLAADVERLLLAGLTGGQLHEMLAAAIQRRLQVSTNRAELIAVDQIGKINGQVTAARHRALGVTRFKWISVGDERVRGNPTGLYPKAEPSHFARNGKRYAYADPPKGKNGESELPGVPVRCRCFGTPIMDDLLGAPVPADPAAPVASVESAEAEAARLMAEVEAMLAGQPLVQPAKAVAPVTQPAPPPPPGAAVVSEVGPPEESGHRQAPPVEHRSLLLTGKLTAYAAGSDAKRDLGVNGSYTGLVVDSAGSAMRAKIKPSNEEEQLGGVPMGTMYLREAAAADVAKLLGVADMMPATVVRTLDPPLGRSSLQAFHEGALSTRNLTGEQQARIDRSAVARMRVFDFAIGNPDRHGGNVMWIDDGVAVRPALIDHGYSFPSLSAPYGLNVPSMSNIDLNDAPLSASDRAAIAAIDLTAVADTLVAAGIDDAGIRGTLHRITVMKSAPDIIDKLPDGTPYGASNRWSEEIRAPGRRIPHATKVAINSIVEGARQRRGWP